MVKEAGWQLKRKGIYVHNLDSIQCIVYIVFNNSKGIFTIKRVSAFGMRTQTHL